MSGLLAWLDSATTAAHGVMVQHLVRVQDDPSIGMRECVEVIRAAAQISAFNKAKACAASGGLASVIDLATELVIALAATPTWFAIPTEEIYERHYLAAWALILGAQRRGEI